VACAECDDSLPFSWACSIPVCYTHFSSTLFHQLVFHHLMFFLRVSWIDYILIINLMHWLLLFIKYYSPLHVSSLKCSSSGGYSCTHAAYGTVTLCESFWWSVGTQLKWELTAGGRLLVGRRMTPFSSTLFHQLVFHHLMFFWPCFMNWLYIDYKFDALIIIIHKILFSSTCFEHQLLIFRRTQLYICSIWYRHSL